MEELSHGQVAEAAVFVVFSDFSVIRSGGCVVHLKQWLISPYLHHTIKRCPKA